MKTPTLTLSGYMAAALQERVQAFVPTNALEGFKKGIEQVFGEDSCHVLNIRPVGGTEVEL